MKNWILIVAIVLFITPGSGTGWSQSSSGVENPAIRNPVGLSTVPPSSIQSGLVDSPDPIDTSGNLIVTGNVRRGRHFRGTMPYQSATSFRATLGSSRLESFLRDSAGAEDFGSYAGMYATQPYYSVTETVATTRPGRSGVFKPASTRISDRAPDMFGLEPLTEEQDLSSRDTSISDIRFWGPQTRYSTLMEPRSMVLSPQEIEQLGRQELGIYRRGERLDLTEGVRKRYQNQMEMDWTTEAIKGVWEPELLRRSLEQMGDESAELGRSSTEKDDSLRRFPEGGVGERSWTADGGFVMQAPKGQMEGAAGRRSALGIPSFLGDEFTTARDSALPEGHILWGQAQDLTSGQALQQAPKWEREPKVDEGRAEAGKSDTGHLGTLGLLQEQSQREGFPNAMESVGGADVFERVRQQLDDLAKSIDARLQIRVDGTGESTSTKRAGQQSMRTRAESASLDSLKASPLDGLQGVADGEIEAGEDALYFDEMVRETATAGSFGEKSSALDGLGGLSQADRPKAGTIQSRAERIMGSHKSFESYLEAKFNQHILAAESYLRQGRYHRAADSFALASIYKLVPGEGGSELARAFPDTPAPVFRQEDAGAETSGLAISLAGRGHALFAAGEYISSALFISRAIEADPEYARAEIVDFATMLGGVGKVESRIADIKEWLGKSGAAELQFLLGYVYYRMGKLQEAKEAIDAAYEKKPQSPAVDIVRKAIIENSKCKNQNAK